MIQSVDYLAIAPPLILAVAGLLVLVSDAFSVRLTHLGALVGVLAAAGAEVALAVVVLRDRPRGTFCVGASCSYTVDRFTLLFQAVMLIAGVVVGLLARNEVRGTRVAPGELYFLLLAALAPALALAA